MSPLPIPDHQSPRPVETEAGSKPSGFALLPLTKASQSESFELGSQDRKEVSRKLRFMRNKYMKEGGDSISDGPPSIPSDFAEDVDYEIDSQALLASPVLEFLGLP